MYCDCCPRHCAADREKETGFCGAGPLPRVARAALHFYEEPVFSGTRGSGTVFFSGCNMRCVYCQNERISARQTGALYTAEGLAEVFLRLQEEGAHNINLVTAAPHLFTLLKAIPHAKQQGLTIPILYNSGGYERVDALKKLDGMIDIYLPDLKYVSAERSEAYSQTPDYFSYAAPALQEMFRQAGILELDAQGIAKKGMLIRHLVLPGNLKETRMVLDHIQRQFPSNVHIALMRQYTPVNPVLPAPLHRPLTKREYERAVSYCLDLGFTNVFLQKGSSVSESFIPSFV